MCFIDVIDNVQVAGMNYQITVYVSIIRSGANHQEVIRLADNLVSELQGTDGVQVFEDEEKKLGASDLHAIVVKLAGTGAIDRFVNAIGSWLIRDRSRTLKLQIGANSIEATGLTHEEQRELIRWFQLQTGIKFNR